MIRIPPSVGENWVEWARRTAQLLTQIFGRMGADRLTWNAAEDTLNISHVDGIVSQQVGFEEYMRCKNNTASTIPEGTAVSFSGVSGDITVAPYIADGTQPNIYFVGVTTFDMAPGDIGPVTIYGKVRGLNTSAWTAGTILYASPSTAGMLTSTRPTTPNEVVVVAAVIVQSATAGEIMVRPTIPLGLDYGAFSDTTAQTAASANTAYAVKFNTTDISHGVTVVSDGSNPTRLTVSDAGLYSVTVSNQYTSSNASSKNVQTWLRKNGTDVAHSNSYVSISANGQSAVFSSAFLISLQAGDYIQIMWATNDTTVSLNAIAATGYSPSAPSSIVTVSQVQL